MLTSRNYWAVLGRVFFSGDNRLGNSQPQSEEGLMRRPLSVSVWGSDWESCNWKEIQFPHVERKRSYLKAWVQPRSEQSGAVGGHVPGEAGPSAVSVESARE